MVKYVKDSLCTNNHHVAYLSVFMYRYLIVILQVSAFDTIDHVNLFDVLIKYIGFEGNTLLLIMSYLSDRTQQVQIDGIFSECASIVCGIPQGSVLGHLTFCLYMLCCYDGYHLYADGAQIYVSFKCDDPSQALDKINFRYIRY